MTFEELAAALTERLYFYESVLDKMEKAVTSGDTDRIEAYSELESRTAAEIACLRECFTARGNEAPLSGEHGSAIGGLMEKAGAASRRLRGVLEKEKQAVLVQLQDIRKKIPSGSLRPEPPSVIDYQA
jgi:hypothetical protein